jgi:DNA-directed RNA polymerase alpha subunit
VSETILETNISLLELLQNVKMKITKHEVRHYDGWEKDNPIIRNNLDGISDISYPIYSALKKAGINTIAQLIVFSEAEIRDLPGIGKGSIKKIRDYLVKYQLKMGSGYTEENTYTFTFELTTKGE